jgi:hypothetical protein
MLYLGMSNQSDTDSFGSNSAMLNIAMVLKMLANCFTSSLQLFLDQP